MKTPQSVEASMKGALDNAKYHTNRVLDTIESIEVILDASPKAHTAYLEQLRDHADSMAKFVHEFNAYHNVLFTE